MARSNLRSAFALGLGSTVAAQQVFTNRVTEVAAFEAALDGLAATLDRADVSLVIDRAAPRTNVLVYFGVGGIGKSTLSGELRRRFLDGKEYARAAAYVDFAEANAVDLEAYVLRLRASLGHLAHRWPAFDLAFSVYWERAHPGEPLHEFVTRHSSLQRVAKTVGLSEQMASGVANLVMEALPGVASTTRRVAGLLYSQARKAIDRHHALKRCELLSDLIEADADLDSLAYYPYLLAWDLDQVRPRPRAVVFVDTFEAVVTQENREFEQWLQRGMFLMPNVLFVITGRNRLDWADLSTTDELDYVGVERWPYLHAGHADADPRQHLVGYLSTSDAETYLRTALTDNGAPAIPPAIRDRIAGASGGLPLYLDLAVNEFLDLLARGRTPAPDEFGQPLASIVARLLRDLERDERQLLRAAALVDAFDLDLLRAGCPEVPDAVYRRFRDRPFLELDTDRAWPYALHQILRETIRAADMNLRDSWSQRERTAVAGRMAAHLADLSGMASNDGDRGGEVAAFRIAMDLSVRTGEFYPWMIAAAQRLLTSGSWDLPVGPARTGAVGALMTGLRGARERRAGNAERSLELMETALAVADLPATLRSFLLLHRAHALRVAGRYALAAQDYALLAATEGDIPVAAVYWLTDYQYLSGRFADALAALDRLESAAGRVESEHLDGEVLRLRGHVYRVNGMFAEAEQHYRQALSLAKATGNIAAEGKALTDVLQTLAWCRPAAALDLLTDARDVNSGIRNRVELVKLHAAAAVAHRGQGHPDLADAEIERGLALTAECGYPGGAIWCWVARAYTQLARADESGYSAAVSELQVLSDALGGNRFWVDIALSWTEAARADDVTVQWIGGALAASERWREILHA